MDVPGLMSRGCSSEVIVGIGVPKPQFEATAARLSERSCGTRLERFDSPRDLVSALRDGRIDAAVRGTLPSSETLSELKAAFALRSVMRVAVLTDRMRRPFLLAPVGIDEGRDMSERLKLALAASEFFGQLGWKLSVGVLSKGRTEDGDRGEDIRSSLDEGEELASQLVSAGSDARHYAILVERAVAERDLVLAPDGVTGNLMFRTLHLVGGCEAYGAPIVNMRRVFVDTTRAKADFSDAVMLAAGLTQSIG
ncbi:MAG TPA: methanogenesis marker protein Mmp4/MtxX [Thermoplasmata archaeon]|nr:methanogenesis marker protein Mmp4/MtxX [Thermoplasmata archaeon]